MKIVSIVGARPQFVKAAPVSRALRASGISEFLVHTGQHYDDNISEQFFRDLEIPKPDRNLEVGSGPHGWQTGQMLVGIENILQANSPDWVTVYGDTNSTLAGALAAVKMHIPVAHVEAGLRSFNRRMPEENNRVLTDHCASLLFCPTETAVHNLSHESITEGVHLVGDTMYDAFLAFVGIAQEKSRILEKLTLNAKSYLLATVHRAENTDSPSNLKNIIAALSAVDEPIIFPVHPRTKKKIIELGLGNRIAESPNLKMIEPIGYLDMLLLEKNAKMIITDSGGVQKEAYFCQVPCVTLREETEWVETVEAGWNTLAGNLEENIVNAVRSRGNGLPMRKDLYGDGHAAAKIAKAFL